MLPIASLLIAILGLLAIQIAGRRHPALSVITLATLLTLPLLNFLPKIHLTLPTDSTLLDSPSSNLFPFLYLGGFLFFAGQFLRDLISFRFWKAQATPLPNNDSHLQEIIAATKKQLNYQPSVQVLVHPQLQSPVAAGLLRPRVYLPEASLSWNTETLTAVLLHELGHHARRDLWTSLGARLACIVNWFNPLAWILRRQLLAQCEFACDARVLATGINAKSYAHTLCDLALPAGSKAPTLAIAMATKSSLRDRVENLLSPHQPLTLLPIVTTILLTAGTALALSVLRPSIPRSFAIPSDIVQEAQFRLGANPFPGN